MKQLYEKTGNAPENQPQVRASFFERVFLSDFFCLAILICALLVHLKFIYTDIDPFISALTTSLRQNVMERYDLSLVWGGLIGGAVFFNVKKLNLRIGFKGSVPAKIANFMLYLSIFFLFVNCTVLEHDIDIVHSTCSMLFAFIAMFSMMISMLHASKYNLLYLLVTAILIFIFYLATLFFLELSPKGVWETFPIASAFIALFLVNFTDAFKLKNKAAIIAKRQQKKYEKRFKRQLRAER
ncbi:MAG: hypothetical protein LBQ40_04675 [Clostridiales bacterium]|jgi:hypothetical protein|nr:hypothetical protein [Clostridiales bacterium]